MFGGRLLRLDVRGELLGLERGLLLLHGTASTELLQHCAMASGPLRFRFARLDAFETVVEVDLDVLGPAGVLLAAEDALLVALRVVLLAVRLDDRAPVQGAATELFNVPRIPRGQPRTLR